MHISGLQDYSLLQVMTTVFQVSGFGSEVPIGRPGQPKEFCAPAVFLACEDSSYVVGAILGVTGGGLIN